MNGEQIDEKIMKRLAAKKLSGDEDEITWDRKPVSLASVSATASASHPELRGKPTLQAKDIMADPAGLSDFTKSVPQIFFMIYNGTKYAVDTQGYNYARYVVKIRG